jgi:hypothetical protein
MRWIPKSVVLLLFALAVVLSSLPVFAQSLPDKKEASEWVKKALEASDLHSPDAPPYHLVAKIHYAIGKKTLAGTYEILWAAPDKYRLELRTDEIDETDLVLGDKKYVARNTPTMTLPMASITSTLFFSTLLPGFQSPYSVRKLSWAGDAANRQICAIVGESIVLDHELCFDAKTTQVTAAHTHSKRPTSVASVANWAISMDVTDYVSLGKLRYPQRLERRSGPESVDATVEYWEAVQKFSDDAFVPLPNSTVWDWCSSPKIEIPKSFRPIAPPVSVDPIDGTPSFPYVGLYKVVRADGTVKEATLLVGSPQGSVKEFLDKQLHGRSAIHVCGTKPVEYETVSVMWLTIRYVQ